MTNNNSLQNDFFYWLGDKVSVLQMSDLFLIYSEIDNFSKEIGLLKAPLFQTKDLLTVSLVKRMVETNKNFRTLHRKKLKKMTEAIDFYYSYIKTIN